MTWHTGRLCAYDSETSGVSVFDDRIITAHAALVSGGQPTVAKDWAINPGIPIPAGATEIHGITDEMAAGYADPASSVDLIAGELCLAMGNGIPVVGYNVAYDLSLLDSELRRYELPSLVDRLGRPVGPVICGFVLDKHCDPFRKGSRKLVAAAKQYAIDLPEAEAHGAAADAMASARVLYRMGQIGTSEGCRKVLRLKNEVADRFVRVAAMSVDELHAAQIVWAAEQADGLKAYFTRVGKHKEAATVDGAWPVRYPVGARAAVPA